HLPSSIFPLPTRLRDFGIQNYEKLKSEKLKIGITADFTDGTDETTGLRDYRTTGQPDYETTGLTPEMGDGREERGGTPAHTALCCFLSTLFPLPSPIFHLPCGELFRISFLRIIQIHPFGRVAIADLGRQFLLKCFILLSFQSDQEGNQFSALLGRKVSGLIFQLRQRHRG